MGDCRIEATALSLVTIGWELNINHFKLNIMATFSDKESILNTYFGVVVAYIVLNFSRLGVSLANKATLIANFATWTNIYPLATTPATSTVANVKDKNISKRAMLTILRLIFGDIAISALTSTDRTTMNMPFIGGFHPSVPIGNSEPNGSVDDGFKLAHKITYMDNTSGKKAKPHGVTGCEIWQKIGGVAPVSVSDLQYLETISKNPLIISFEGTQGGLKVYYWMRWINKHSKGNWGPEFSGTVMP